VKHTYPVQIENMDADAFKMLAEQKQELLQLLSAGTASDRINGVVHLIDHIQDTAVDQCELPEDLVFPRVELPPQGSKIEPYSAEALEEEYGYWTEHPNFVHEDWRHDISQGDTLQGYWSWVESCVQNQLDELNNLSLEELPLRINDDTLCPEAQEHLKHLLEGKNEA